MSEGLPIGWAAATLEQVVDRPRPKAAPSDFPELPFVGMDSIAPDGMRLLHVGRFGEMKSAGGVFEPGDVLYGRMRPYLNKVHCARQRGACSAEFIVMPPGAAVRGEFLSYLLHQRAFVNFASEQSSGDRPRVDFDGIASFKFGLPPLAEQDRIVSRIEELFSEIDEGERSLTRVQKLEERYRQSVLKAAVTGALTSGWSQRPELNKRSSARTSEPLFEGLPAVPSDWQWMTLGSVIEAGPQNGVYLHKSDYGDGVAIVRIDDFQPGWIRPVNELRRVRAERETQERYALREDDFVLNRVNSRSHLGKCFVVGPDHAGCLYESNMMRFRVAPALSPRYLELYLRSEVGRRRLTANCKHAVNQASINQGDVIATPVPVPPLQEQAEILDRVDRAFGDANVASSVLLSSAAQAAALRQTILRAAFSGQLVPQDPTDEPASALLARLAEQSAGFPATPGRRAPRVRSKGIAA
jgi:type I restriction enzyme S subunit